MRITSFQKQSVRGFLHHPSSPVKAGLVLTHGAGSNCESPLLIALATAFCQRGTLVFRGDLPFRQKRPKGLPTPVSGAEDRSGLREAASLIREMSTGSLILAGHSYGGRQATLLAASEPDVADALLLLSYPLHPPAKPSQLRTAHWPTLQTPSFFVHGTKDPFGSLEEMQSTISLIPAPTALVTIQKAGHDLNRGKFDIENFVLAPFQSFDQLCRDPAKKGRIAGPVSDYYETR